MNLIKKLLVMTLCIISLGCLVIPNIKSKASETENIKHVVVQGETIWDIAKQYGVPIQALKEANDNDNNVAVPGETFIIPTILNDHEKELLGRLVHAEAKGEPYDGKVAVASVVLNRVTDKEFPDSISEVIYQKNQFSPVDDGSIRKAAGEEAIEAVNEAIAIQGYTYHELYFYNPSISDSKWMRTLNITRIIGGHHFAI